MRILNFIIFNQNWGWGLGIGDWGLGIGPNPQSPIPNFNEEITTQIINL
jgi:hypothetical protein